MSFYDSVENNKFWNGEISNKPDRKVVAGSSVPNRTVAQAGDELCDTLHLEDSKPFWIQWGKSIGTPIVLDGEKCSMRLSEVPD